MFFSDVVAIPIRLCGDKLEIIQKNKLLQCFWSKAFKYTYTI